MAKINNKLLDELKEMNVQDYELKDVVISRIREQVTKQYGVYIDIKNDMIKDTIKESVEGIGERLISTYDSLDTAKLVYEFSYQGNWIIFRGIVLDNIELYVRVYGSRNLIYLLRYAINGKFDKDFAESNEIGERNGLSSTLGKAQFKIDNVSVVGYKNGKVVVHGLEKEAIDRIADGFKLVEKYRNVQL